MKAIGIIGHDGAGKSTLAKYIQTIVPNSQIVSFATPLKNDLAFLGIDATTKPMSPEIRTLCRAYADAQKSIHGDNYWVVRTNTMLFRRNAMFIFDDVRHFVERDWIQNTFDCHFIQLNNIDNVLIDIQFKAITELEMLLKQSNELTTQLTIDKTQETYNSEFKDQVNNLICKLS